MRQIAMVMALSLGAGVSLLHGHEILDPIQVNRILKSMQQAKMTIEGTAPAREKEQALFNMGVDAYVLMKLINSDLREHGAENQGLIDLAVNRCRAMGVAIQRPPGRDYYMYDFAAFTTYLKLAPRGEHAAEARFALIEKSFYDENRSQQGGSVEQLLRLVEEKQQLLRDFPKLGRRADVEMFLILDYLELQGLYLAQNDATKSDQYRDRALALCRRVIEEYPDTAAATFARNLLIKFGL